MSATVTSTRATISATTKQRHICSRISTDSRSPIRARLRFSSGRRKKAWNKNVVSLGLASGFIEPLESTSIFLVQSGISRLLALFPEPDFSPMLIDRFNDQTAFEWEPIRDFLVLHYNDRTQRLAVLGLLPHDGASALPAQIHRAVSRQRTFFRDADELFAIANWVEVFIGQGVIPRRYHPVVDQLSDAQLDDLVGGVKRVVANCVGEMPMHQEFIDYYCKASPP